MSKHLTFLLIPCPCFRVRLYRCTLSPTLLRKPQKSTHKVHGRWEVIRASGQLLTCHLEECCSVEGALTFPGKAQAGPPAVLSVTSWTQQHTSWLICQTLSLSCNLSLWGGKKVTFTWNKVKMPLWDFSFKPVRQGVGGEGWSCTNFELNSGKGPAKGSFHFSIVQLWSSVE